MTRWIYVRTMVDKYRGPSFYVVVTGVAGGSVPGREIPDREELVRVLGRAGLERLVAAIEEAHARSEVFSSGPLVISEEQENLLLGRS